jgi:hypothetical protein
MLVESVCMCNYSVTADCINGIPRVFFIVFLLISKCVAVHIIYGNKYIINSCSLFLFKLLVIFLAHFRFVYTVKNKCEQSFA